MATHSSVLAWRIPETGEPCGLPSMGLQRVGHDGSDLAAAAAKAAAATVHSVLLLLFFFFFLYPACMLYLVFLFCFCFFGNSHSNECEGVSHCGFICPCPMICNVEHLFAYLCHLYVFLGRHATSLTGFFCFQIV